jgi:hypothetical protein
MPHIYSIRILNIGGDIMKKILALLTALVLVSTMALASPVKEPGQVRVAGNTGFTDIVYDDITGQVTGWVRYSIEGDCLRTTWVLDNVKPGYYYQLKVHASGLDERLHLTGDTATSGVHHTGDSYLVMDIKEANPQGKVRGAVHECGLPSGEYDRHFFVITEHEDPWPSGSTWQDVVWQQLSYFRIK